MKFYLDEDVPVAIADALRRRKIDVLTAAEAGNTHGSDRAQLDYAAKTGRCLVTRNVAHFVRLAEQAIQRQRPHAGILLISSRYRGNEIRRITDGIVRVAEDNPAGLEEYAVRYL
jgi:predicted nuclease of predicted toxin-antitoxin system